MSSVEEDICLLIQIVKKDMEIQEKKKFLEDAPVQIKEIDGKIRVMEEEFGESRLSLEKLDKERRHLEREVRVQNDRITQKKIEQNSVKTNKEFRALNTEIEYLSKLVDKEEERILAILEDTEARKEEAKYIQEMIDREKGVLLADRKKLEDGIRESEEALKILEDEKVRILPHISEGVRNLYNRILSVKGDSGVANLEGDICRGCYSRVPPQKAYEIRKNNRIMTCEWCGRILVFYSTD